MSSFININNKEEIIEAKYSANVIRKALLISETKSSIKADKLTKNIDAPISLNEALVLFSDKLNAMRHLTKLSLVESEEVSQELNNNISELELNEGAMSEIHRLAQEAKDVVDFTKKFFKEFGDKIKKSTESTEWVQGLYNDVVSESKLEEGKSIGKIQKEYGQVVKDMITTVEEWKTAEGDRKKELLEKLRSLTAQKKQLSSDLDDAVGIKDLNVELAEDHSENPNDKYEVRPCDKPETPYGVWEGDVLVKCFETEEEADIYAKEQNKEQGLDESVITEANGQTVKEFGDLLALLLDEDSGMDIERAINAMPPKNARVLEKQISTLYKKLFDLTNQGFDLREDSSVANEAFSRMSKDAIGNELYAASQELSKYYDWLKAGNDSGKGKTLDSVIALLKKCKSSIKRFNKPEEVKGTAFESFVNEAEDYKYKKNVKLAFDTINDEMFKFRHSLGIKTLTNKDMKLKKKVEGLANVIFDLEKEMKAGGLSESKQHSVQTNKINESETVYHKYDFEGMWAQKLGMTREEYVAHFATMTVGVDESTTKDYNGTQFDVKGINFTYTDVGRFYGASLYDVPKTANVSKRAKFSLSEITQFLASIGIKDEVPVRYDTKDLDKICKKLAKKGIVCDHDDFMDVS